MHPSPTHRWLSPDLLSERWDPAYLLHTLPGMQQWPRLGELARITEGWRADDSSAPVIGSNDIRDQRLELPDRLLLNPPPSSHFAVGPGDVLISKFPPFRAAWLPTSVPRYPSNANCIRLLKLSPEWACWLPHLLELPEFARMLVNQTAGMVMPRIGIADLRELQVPPPPTQLQRLAAEWAEAAENLLTIQKELALLRAEVDVLDMPLPPKDSTPAFYPPTYLFDSLLPGHVTLTRYQAELADERWWPLAKKLVQEPARLREDIPPIRLLRLSNVDDAFRITMPELESLQKVSFRLYATPLLPDEVLLSTLGTAPKVLFNHPPAPSTLWLSDQWVRISSEHPGALALLLGTSAVRWQLNRAATGVARQFVGREELGQIRLPYLPVADLERLHQQLCSILQRRVMVEQQLEKLRNKIKEAGYER